MRGHQFVFAALVMALAAACSPPADDKPKGVADLAGASPSASPASQGGAEFAELDAEAATLSTSAGELDLKALARKHDDQDGGEARVNRVYDFGDGVVLVDVVLFGGMHSSDLWIYRVTAQGQEMVLHQGVADSGALNPDLTRDLGMAGFAKTPERPSYWTCRITFDATTRRPVSATMTENPDGVDAKLCALE